MEIRSKPRVFVDADVLFAGSVAPNEHLVSLVILRLSEITLIEALASRQVIEETERNLENKIPSALSAFRLLVDRCLLIVDDPEPSFAIKYKGLADPKDLSILAAALTSGCTWLVTYYLPHYQPGHPDIKALTPGDFVLQVRDLLSRIRWGE